MGKLTKQSARPDNRAKPLTENIDTEVQEMVASILRRPCKFLNIQVIIRRELGYLGFIAVCFASQRRRVPTGEVELLHESGTLVSASSRAVKFV